MAYEKQTWVTGEVITKEKLNHMEDGIANSDSGSGVFIANVNADTGVLDKTWNEINTALINKQPCYMFTQEDDAANAMFPIVSCYISQEKYKVSVVIVHNSVTLMEFVATAPDSYPSLKDDSSTSN